MKRPIQIHQVPLIASGTAMAICPIGLFANKELQKAQIGDVVVFHIDRIRYKKRIVNIARFRINTPEFTFMLRSVYGENMTIARLFERWETWAVVEGLSKDGFDREYAILIEVKPIDED